MGRVCFCLPSNRMRASCERSRTSLTCVLTRFWKEGSRCHSDVGLRGGRSVPRPSRSSVSWNVGVFGSRTRVPLGCREPFRFLGCWYRTGVHPRALESHFAIFLLGGSCARRSPHCTASSTTHCCTMSASRRRCRYSPRLVLGLESPWGRLDSQVRILGTGSWCPACLCMCVGCVRLSFSHSCLQAL